MNRTKEVFDGVNFTDQDMSNLHFIQCKFYNCIFTHADLSDCHFVDCSFVEPGAVSGVNFEYVNLQDASFKNCQLAMASFKGANCFGAEFRNCDLKGANFYKASFANQISRQVYFCSVYITGCNLSYANFERQHIEKCDLFENKWTGANLYGASMQGSDLSRGVFSSDCWGQFNLKDCDLSNAELYGLDPRKVDLSGVKICLWQQEQLLEPLGVIVGPD